MTKELDSLNRVPSQSRISLCVYVSISEGREVCCGTFVPEPAVPEVPFWL